ncbi:MAG: Na/Pi cotransporter family protein [Myxococcales bacterium]|nr:Na/Pi cotransporter family protein [Myxococcales bacterium]
MIGTFLGGVGLFMLGMQQMTEGLEQAQGRAMRRLLARWTHTPIRGMLAGAVVTALVHSSGAVIVAALGFVNAGLLSLLGALWIVFGANIGTTATGWLVALVGFGLDLKALALPFLGLGMGLSVLMKRGKLAGLGQATAGFGLFFLGVAVLQAGFLGLADKVDLTAAAGYGVWSTVLFVGVGFGMTVLMQSSTAVLAIAITATAGKLLPVEAAAAVAIGANVGTTSTAAFAVIGASANAKRLAAGHVFFNLITGVVALFALPWLLQAAMALSGGGLATGIAWFHTLFNVLGVLLMWPMAGRLAGWLSRRFSGPALPEAARPKYIEAQMLADPPAAVQALTRELGHLAELARKQVVAALSAEAPTPGLARDHLAVRALSDAIGEFVTGLQRQRLEAAESEALPHALHAVAYYNSAADLAQVLTQQLAEAPEEGPAEAQAAITWFKSTLLERLDHEVLEGRPKDIRADINADYQALKSRLLNLGVGAALDTHALVGHLERMALLRRAVRQLIKGHKQLRQLSKRSATQVDLRRTGPLPTLV